MAENWCALLLSIIRNKSAEDALLDMGIKQIKLFRLIEEKYGGEFTMVGLLKEHFHHKYKEVMPYVSSEITTTSNRCYESNRKV